MKALGNLIKLMITQSVDILSQPLQSELGVRFAVRLVKDIHQLPDNTAEALHKTVIRAFQGGNCLLFLYRSIARLLEEAPTPYPSFLG
jgi:hypothetical protein